MKIEILAKNYSPSQKLKDILEKKVEKLDKFFDEDTTVKAVLKEESKKHDEEKFTLELTIIVDGIVMRAEVTSGNMYGNVDLAIPKIEKQIIRHQKKLASKSKKFKVKGLSDEDIAAVNEEPKAALVRAKTFALVPMTVEDAIDDMELIGHQFYVFLNGKSQSVNVVYRRKDGDYGLIETIS